MPSKPNPDFASEQKPEYSRESAFPARTVDAASTSVQSSCASAEPLGKHAIRPSGDARSVNHRSVGAARSPEFHPVHVLQPRHVADERGENAKRPLRVMKFGGTSVADAFCIERVAEIVSAAARESHVVVVVSAMSGVTNKLVEAANQSEAGNRDLVATIFEELRKRHESAASALIHSAGKLQPISRRMRELFQEADGICQEAIQTRKLTQRARDSIAGLGERLSAPLVAAALAERGVTSEAIEATELVVTDSCHGAAEAFMDRTRERCEARLRPLLMHGVVAVVTGFIGATEDGVLTTLGRNSSDYSGTIVGAAIDADEVTLWTDVDGILTADPRLVPDASSILEMSYREASDLADLGAKVLHPKTLHPLMQRGIPLAIRNTFAPDRPGTKITPTGSSTGAEIKVLTATNNVALITVQASGTLAAPDILRRTLATAAAVPADVRLIPQSSSLPSEVCIVISSAATELTVEALRREFKQDMARETVRDITFDPLVAVVTVVTGKMLATDGFVTRALGALSHEKLRVLASTHTSNSSFSFVVATCDMNAALVTAHRELQLSTVS